MSSYKFTKVVGSPTTDVHILGVVPRRSSGLVFASIKL